MTSSFETQLQAFIQAEMQQDLAHDMQHVLRVVAMAKTLCAREKACLDIVLPAAYLHDCFSFPKNHPQRAQSSWYAAEKAIQFLTELHYPNQYLSAIHHAIVAHSFSANVPAQTLEAKIVQDADRLDALGAVGIARCLQVSASLNRPLYHSDDPFCEQRPPNDSLYTLDHFYNKLLLLKHNMHTETAKQEAQQRSAFMQAYLTALRHELNP